MGSTVTEQFIRRHVRRILAEEPDKPKSDKPKSDKPKSDKPKSDKPKSDKPKSAGEIWSGVKGGRLPKWAIEALGGSKKAERLAFTNPQALMKNLKINGAPSGSTTVDRVEMLVQLSIKGRPEMGEAFSSPEKRSDGAGKKGVFVPAGELAGRTGSILIHDLVYGAWKAGTLRLTGNLRIESMDGGTVIFNVREKSDRWE